MSKKVPKGNEIRQIAGALILAFTTGSAFAGPVEADLTSGSGLSATVNGAIFSNPSTLSNNVSGTGVFNTFVKIQNNPVEQGYNTSKRRRFPSSPPNDTNTRTNFDTGNESTHNRNLQLKEVNTLLYSDNIVYRQFLLDINEGKNSTDNFLSLDMLQIYISSSAGNFIPDDNQGVLGADNALGELVYNMDAGTNGDSRILLNYAAIGSGSGRPDLQVLIPNSIFLGYDKNSYLYLYSSFGDKGCVDANGDPDSSVDACKKSGKKKLTGKDYGANAGFEEWGNFAGVSDFCTTNPTDPQCTPPPPPPAVPELGVMSMLGLGLGLLGLAKIRRKTA